MAEVALPSPYATLSFNAGRGVDSLRFSEDFGAMSSGWNSENLNREAYYEYTLSPAPGIRILVNQLNLEVSLSRVNMRTSVQYSYDGFTRQKTQIGHTVYIATHVPRNLPVKTTLSVTYPQTLSIRVYGWSTVDYLVSFHTRNVVMEAQVFGRDLLVNAPTDTLSPQPTSPEIGPASPETLAALPEVSPEFPQSDTAQMDELLAAMAVLPPLDTLAGNGNGGERAPLGDVTFTSSGTWICPPGVTSVRVECWGGGAGGHNGNSRGGGGGAYAGNNSLSVTPGNSYTITVSPESSNGGDGSNSSFSNLVVAAGAIGGNGGTVAASTGAVRRAGGNGGYSTGNGGAGGGGSAGAGGAGGNGVNTNNNTGGAGGIAGIAGTGTAGANGGNGGSNNNDGSNGASPGGGGGERGENGGSSGNGANGQVIISWTIPAGNCEGFAISQTNNNVDNSGNATDSPDGLGALMQQNGDRLTLDLTGDNNLLLTTGGSVTIRWGRFYSGDADIIVDISSNNINWYNEIPYTLTNDIGFVDQVFNLTINTRYIRFRKPNTNTREIRIDAISYNTPCGPPCANPNITSQPANSTICAGGNTSFYVTATGTALTYQWQVNTGAGWNNITNGGVYSNSTTATLNLIGVAVDYNGYLYRCIVYSGSCSTTSSSATLTVNPLPIPTISGPSSVCAGSSGNIYTTEAGMTNYTWVITGGNITSGVGTNTITVTWNTAGNQTLSVTYTNTNGCNPTTPTLSYITVNPLPTPSISGPNSVCLNSTGNIYTTETGMTNYLWTITGGNITAGGGTSSATVTWNVAGNQQINVTYTGLNGCSPSAPTSYNVTVDALPTVNAGPDQSICANLTSVSLAGSIGGAALTATWTSSGNGTFANANVVNTTYTLGTADIAAGIVTLTLTTNDPAGPCGAVSDQMIITVRALPAAIAGPDRTIFRGQSTQIGAPQVGGSTYSWTSVPVGFTSTFPNPTVAPLVTTVYTVVETNAYGCIAQHSVTVTVIDNLSITKVATTTPSRPGDNLIYQITCSNLNSSGTAQNVVVTDLLPSADYFTFVSASDAGVFDNPSRTVVWNLGNLNSGQTRTLTVSGIVGRIGWAGYEPNSFYQSTGSSTNIIENNAQIDNPTIEPIQLLQPVQTTVNQFCGVSMPNHLSGEIHTSTSTDFFYMITLKNTGNITDKFTLSNNEQPQTGVPLASFIQTIGGGTLTETPWLAPDQNFTFMLRFINPVVIPVGSINNTFVIATSTVCPDKKATTDIETHFYEVSSNTGPDLVLIKEANSPVIAGDYINYTITVFNQRPEIAEFVSIQDDLPPFVEYISASALPSDVTIIPDLPNNRITATRPSLTNSETIIITITVHTTCGSVPSVMNVARVGNSHADINDDNNFYNLVTVVNSPILAPSVPGTTICPGTSATLTASGASSGYSYRWYDAPTGGNLLFTGNPFLTPLLNVNTTYYVSMFQTGSNPVCEGLRTPALVTVLATPVILEHPQNQSVCAGDGTSFFITMTTGEQLSYQWEVSTNNGGTWTALTNAAPYSGVATPTLIISATTFSMNGYLYRVKVRSATCPQVTSLVAQLTVFPAPAITITGNHTVCQGSTGNVYTTQAGMTNYIWAISAGGTITAGGTSTSNTVTVTWNTAGAQTVSVIYTNANNCSTTAPTVFNVTVNPTGVPTINGPTPVCAGSTSNVYTTEAGMTNYLWTVSAGGTITAGGTIASNSVTVTWTTAGNQNVSVRYTNSYGCTSLTATNYQVIVNPLPAVTCPSDMTVCVNRPPFALTGGIPSGGTYSGPGVSSGVFSAAIAGVGTHTITYSYTDGNSCNNICTFIITVDALPVGSAITPQTICSGETTSIELNSTVEGTIFSWTVAPLSGAAITGSSPCSTTCGNIISQTLFNSTDPGIANPNGGSTGVVRYTITPTANGCVGDPFIVDVTVNPRPPSYEISFHSQEHMYEYEICDGDDVMSQNDLDILYDFPEPLPWNYPTHPPANLFNSCTIAWEYALSPSGPWLAVVPPGTLTIYYQCILPPAPSPFSPIGEYYFRFLVTNSYGCSRASNSILFSITSTLTIDAGGPDIVCTSSSPAPISLTGASVGGTSTTQRGGIWSIVSGGGSLSNTGFIRTDINPNALAAVTYTPAAGFIGTAVLKLTSNDPDGNGVCLPLTETREIHVVSGGSFTGCVEPADWLLTNTNANGSMDAANVPCWLTLIGGDNGSGNPGTTDMTNCTGTGNFTFEWSFSSPEDYDAPPVWHTADQVRQFGAGASNGNIIAGRPGNVSAGDLIIVIIHARDNVGVITPPTGQGFILIRRETSGSNGDDNRGFVQTYWKIATASEPASYTFVAGSMQDNDTWATTSGRVTGFDPTLPILPIQANSGTNSGTSGVSSLTIPQITGGVNNRLLLAALSLTNRTVYSFNNPNGTTSIYLEGTNLGDDLTTAAAIQTIGAGNTGTRSFSWGNSNERAAAQMFTINPRPAIISGDAAYYLIDGVPTLISNTNGTSGTETVPVNSGSSVGFRVATNNNQDGPGRLSIYNLNVPVPALSLSCPADPNLPACSEASAIQAAYDEWVDGFSISQGCDFSTTTNIASIPALGNLTCGGQRSFTYTASDHCDQTANCSSTFTVQSPGALTPICPPDPELPACSNTATIQAAYNTWVDGFDYTGGCNVTTNIGNLPQLTNLSCGGQLSFTYIISDDCGQEEECTATFTVLEPQALTVSCPDENPTVLPACMAQAEVNTAFAAWIAEFSVTGGCNPTVTDLTGYYAPNACGGSVTINYSAFDDCGNTSECSASFTVTDAPLPVLTCPSGSPITVTIDNGSDYVHSGTTWDAIVSNSCGDVNISATLELATTSGPHTTLNGVHFNVGTTTVTWTGTDNCGHTVSCSFDVIVVQGSADISVVKTGPATITAGQLITWTITVTNLGPATAPEVILTDFIPIQVIAPITYTLGGVAQGNWPVTNTLSLTNITAGVGGARVIAITGKVDCAAGNFANTASVALTPPLMDPVSGNNSSTINTIINNALTATLTSQVNVLCFGGATGSVVITPVGGTAPYTITPAQTGLTAGTYTFTVTDANGCTTTINATITQPASGLTITSTVTNTSCPNYSDGSITIEVTGGTPVYAYSWVATNGGVIPAGQGDGPTLTLLVAGTYTVTVTDANGCVIIREFVVGSTPDTQPPTFTAPPGPFSYCVNNIISATYNPNPTPVGIIPEYNDLTTPRPEYYQFTLGSEIFNLDADINNFNDNCCDDEDLIIHWRIVFSPTPNPATVAHELITQPAIPVQTGQPSAYGPIEFPGDGVYFTNTEHHIFYWLTDCNGNSSDEQEVTVTLTPRPNVIKN